jgi:hypothetical protein
MPNTSIGAKVLLKLIQYNYIYILQIIIFYIFIFVIKNRPMEWLSKGRLFFESKIQ